MNQMILLNTLKKITLRNKGFSLLEVLITIGVISLLMTIVVASLLPARDKARDTKRIADLSQIGRFITFGCFQPTGGITSGGVTSIDFADLAAELLIANPQYSNFISQIPQDPSSGSAAQTNYIYIVSFL